jgi:Domain of unknown function (DUF4826)
VDEDMANPSNEELEEHWCEEQHQVVVAYLRQQGVADPNVGEWPAWHIFPVIAVWAVESKTCPNSVGWWAISGDLPTDYTSCGDERHPRQALRDIGERWCNAAASWFNGKRSDLMLLNSPEQERELAPLLGLRGHTLIQWSNDDAIWSD